MRHHTNTATPQRSSRGYAMLIAISVVALMSMLGFIALDVVVGELETASATRRADAALFVAEAGIEWVINEITNEYEDEENFGNIAEFGQLASGTNLTEAVVDETDEGCPNAACTVLLSPAAGRWRRLIETPVTFDTGSFYAYISDDEEDDDDYAVDTNAIILVRVIGRDTTGTQANRVIEVAVELGGE